MLSGYEANGNYSDSCLGGPATDIDTNNNPTVFNKNVNLIQPK